jgi:hypothetical protein
MTDVVNSRSADESEEKQRTAVKTIESIMLQIFHSLLLYVERKKKIIKVLTTK